MTGIKAVKFTLFALLVLILGAAFAVGTPAGTEIRNQASASYIDSAGQSQTTTSNEVVTVVQPVYSFDIQPDSTDSPGDTTYEPGQLKSGLAGSPVYFNYTVTNTGNTTDTISLETAEDATNDVFDFSSTAIYLDDNCNGQIDPGEAEVSSVTLAADASACLVVEAVLPTGYNDGDYGNLNLEGTSEGDSTVTDTNNWAQAVLTSNAALTATKSSSGIDNGTITYTIEGSNVGGSAAYEVTGVVTVDGNDKDGILISDSIPDNTTYVLGSASGTAGAGSVSVIYQTASGWTATEPTTASDVTAVGLLIEGSGAFFPQGAQYQFSFSVTVDSGLDAGTAIDNTATVEFDANGDGDAADDGETVTTNTTTDTVAATYAVLNGPQGDPASDGSTFINSYADPTGKTWNYTETTDTTDPRDDDAETITDSVYGGNVIYFPFTLKNSGNTDDSYTLSINIVDPDTTDTADPTTWACQIVASDGTTPISGAVGPIAKDATFDYIVKCSIPADYEEQGTEDAAHIEVTATSETDPTAQNKVTGIVTDVLPGYGVDIAQHGNAGDNDATNDNPPVSAVDPGTSVNIPFDVYNAGANPDTFDLTTTLPSGWTGTIYPDSNCDGVMDDPAPTPVTDTGLMEAGATQCFILVVDVPANQAPIDLDGTAGTSDDNVSITATSEADSTKTDTITTDVEVNTVYALDFTPDRSGTVTSPGTIEYTHTVTNNGNTSVDVSFSISGSTHDTWTYQISTDGGATWTDVDSGSVSGLAAGASQEITIRVSVPDGEAIGAVDVVTITATAGTASPSVTDTTTVVGGDLRLEKNVDVTEAKPGDTITYTVTASNIGTADLTKVIVTDPLPSYTTFVSVSASADFSGTVMYSTDGSSWSTTAPTSLSAGQSIYVAVDTSGDGNITDADIMPPGATITITFKVQVQ